MSRWEEALLSNEVVDICADDLAALGEDEGAAAGPGSGDAPDPQHDGSLVEVQTFSDLEYSRGKVRTSRTGLTETYVSASCCPQGPPV
jgi:hypothetical protein